MKKAVFVIVTNETKDVFYFQKKDDMHPDPRLRSKYTLFGGVIEDNENEKETLGRELDEELEDIASKTIFDSSKKIFDIIVPTSDGDYTFSIFESILTKEQLITLAKLPVKEGECGEIVENTRLNNNLAYTTKTVMDKYFSYK